MTWSTLVLSQPLLKVEAVGTLGARLVFYLIPATVFLAFDSALPSLAVSIKRQEVAAIPTRTGRASGRRRGSVTPPWYNVIVLSVFNLCLDVALQTAVEYLCTDVFHIRSTFKVTTTVPMPWSAAKDLLRALLLREASHYPSNGLLVYIY